MYGTFYIVRYAGSRERNLASVSRADRDVNVRIARDEGVEVMRGMFSLSLCKSRNFIDLCTAPWFSDTMTGILLLSTLLSLLTAAIPIENFTVTRTKSDIHVFRVSRMRVGTATNSFYPNKWNFRFRGHHRPSIPAVLHNITSSISRMESEVLTEGMVFVLSRLSILSLLWNQVYISRCIAPRLRVRDQWGRIQIRMWN